MRHPGGLSAGVYNSHMLKWLSRSLLFLAGVFVGIQIGVRLLLRFSPRSTPMLFMSLMDHPLRRIYRDTTHTLDFVGLHHNAIVLDIGCGTGLFTLESARRVGSHGTVYAIDFQPELIAAVIHRVEAARLTNVQM